MKIPIYNVKLKVITKGKIINNWSAYVDVSKDTIKLHIKKDAPPGIIAHEALHIANEVANRIYAKHDSNNDEYNAYLIGYIVKRITKKLRKKA